MKMFHRFSEMGSASNSRIFGMLSFFELLLGNLFAGSDMEIPVQSTFLHVHTLNPLVTRFPAVLEGILNITRTGHARFVDFGAEFNAIIGHYICAVVAMADMTALCMTGATAFAAELVVLVVTFNLATMPKLFIVFKRTRLVHFKTMNAGARTCADSLLVPKPRHQLFLVFRVMMC